MARLPVNASTDDKGPGKWDERDAARQLWWGYNSATWWSQIIPNINGKFVFLEHDTLCKMVYDYIFIDVFLKIEVVTGFAWQNIKPFNQHLPIQKNLVRTKTKFSNT